MIVIGLDVSSTSTGWAVLKSKRFYKREGIDFGLIKPHKKLVLAEKLNYFRSELSKVISRVSPDVVGIEDIFLLRNVKTLKLLGRFSGVAIETVYDFSGVVPYIVQVKESRVQWGTQDKEEVFEKIKNKYKMNEWLFKKHNDLTDAISIALYVSSINGSK